MRKSGTTQWLSLYVSYRSPLEPLIMWCTQNANHPGCPGSVDQRSDYPSLGLGKFTSSGRSENTAAFITGAAQCHWVPKVSLFPSCRAPGAGTSSCNPGGYFLRTRLSAKTDVGMANRKLKESDSGGAFHNSRPTQWSAKLTCCLTSRTKQSCISTQTRSSLKTMVYNNLTWHFTCKMTGQLLGEILWQMYRDIIKYCQELLLFWVFFPLYSFVWLQHSIIP